VLRGKYRPLLDTMAKLLPRVEAESAREGAERDELLREVTAVRERVRSAMERTREVHARPRKVKAGGARGGKRKKVGVTPDLVDLEGFIETTARSED
jgi:hypothetical protein